MHELAPNYQFFSVPPASNSDESIYIPPSVYEILGWKGGTIHQVIAEIERLKRSDNLLRALQEVFEAAQ